MKLQNTVTMIALLVLAFLGCDDSKFNIAPMDVRGTIGIIEVHWAGSIKSDGSANNPDDDFIELNNYTNGTIDVGGWVIHVTGDAANNAYTIPSDTLIAPGQYLTIGRTRNGAFPSLDIVFSDFVLPNTPFYLEINDGSGLTSDQADFTLKSWLPGGASLPLLKKSAVRRITFFGPEDGFQLYNWMTYTAPSPSTSVATAYQTTVFASPGEEVANEGFEGEDL